MGQEKSHGSINNSNLGSTKRQNGDVATSWGVNCTLLTLFNWLVYSTLLDCVQQFHFYEALSIWNIMLYTHESDSIIINPSPSWRTWSDNQDIEIDTNKILHGSKLDSFLVLFYWMMNMIRDSPVILKPIIKCKCYFYTQNFISQ